MGWEGYHLHQFDVGGVLFGPHDVVAESIEPPAAGARYPSCLDGKRACPPEDCGGPHGYLRLLAALKDPNDPEHDEYIDWLRKEFRPAAYDVVAANERPSSDWSG